MESGHPGGAKKICEPLSRRLTRSAMAEAEVNRLLIRWII
jgi:hypothetical protein